MQTFQLPLNTRTKYHPIIYVGIHQDYPFMYSVTLKAMINKEMKEIRRWDNVNKPHHVDIFHPYKKTNKHVENHFAAKKVNELKGLFEYIEKYYIDFIKQYEDEYNEKLGCNN